MEVSKSSGESRPPTPAPLQLSRREAEEQDERESFEEVIVEQDPGFVTPPEHLSEGEEEEKPAAGPPQQDGQTQTELGDHNDDYLTPEVLLKHLRRQSAIVSDALRQCEFAPPSVAELSALYESHLFSPRVPPKRQPNGTCEPNPRLNFYPVFAVPEALATYHLFFKNQRIPLSCRANRSRADERLTLKQGDRLPKVVSLEEVPKIFEGLGSEEKRAANALQKEQEENRSILVELAGDNARLAVLKRSVEVSHFAYPALNLPPKVMSCMMDQLLIKRAQPLNDSSAADPGDGQPVVDDQQLSRWLNTNNPQAWQDRRQLVMAAVLVSCEMQCLQRFFADPQTLQKLEESLHYTFRHGYVRQAAQISNVELSNLVSYLGILHENRLGQSVLHSTLRGEARRDYVRDCVYLFLVLTWQTAMGVWQQCLEEQNLKELEKLLQRHKKGLWTGFDETTVAADLAAIVFPEQLKQTLQKGLPDFISQSMLHNFRSFILERSAILPAMSCALPSDFVPLTYRECPPPLWSHCYLLQLANYLAYHCDLMEDVSGEGLLSCHCRCNLCTPHRSLACNPELLSESQLIGTFELQGPEGGAQSSPLKLTPAAWTSAYLRKFHPEDYHPHEIRFYEEQSQPPRAPLSACVITQAKILAQLQAINQARREFLLKKGRGVYLDPQTGEELNAVPPDCPASSNFSPQHGPQAPNPAAAGKTLQKTGAEAAAEAPNLGRGEPGLLGESGRDHRGGGGGLGGEPRRNGGRSGGDRRGAGRGRNPQRRRTVAFGRRLQNAPNAASAAEAASEKSQS
ncbi:100K protein [Simian adenovirus A1173]|uniref:Shutoff protein n=1 Tax=Simian adenovirus A1173 TaxID=1159188 RepID=H9AAF5_9ADEN|nr:100K protein [Simian adenovirus A1173]